MPKSNAEKPCSFISDNKVVLLLSRIRPASKGMSGSWISFPVESTAVTGNLQHKHHNCKLIRVHMDPLEFGLDVTIYSQYSVQCTLLNELSHSVHNSKQNSFLATMSFINYSSLSSYILMKYNMYLLFPNPVLLSSQHQHSFLKIRNLAFTNKLNSTVITILDIIHTPVFYLKNNLSKTGFCLHHQVENTRVGSTDRASHCL
jgi:hypothetical protein